jgi:hypothetical protein
MPQDAIQIIASDQNVTVKVSAVSFEQVSTECGSLVEHSRVMLQPHLSGPSPAPFIVLWTLSSLTTPPTPTSANSNSNTWSVPLPHPLDVKLIQGNVLILTLADIDGRRLSLGADVLVNMLTEWRGVLLRKKQSSQHISPSPSMFVRPVRDRTM